MKIKGTRSKTAKFSPEVSITTGLRQDAIRWREELARLKAEGRYEIVAHVEQWLQEVEKVLARQNEGSKPQNSATDTIG